VEDLRLAVVIDPELKDPVKNVVAFGDFQTDDTTLGTGVYKESEVGRFYRDLILGRSLPLTYVSREVTNLGMILSICLFLRRDLVLHPSMAGVVTASELVDSYGLAGLAHVDPGLATIFRLTRELLTDSPRAELQKNLATVLTWLSEYVLESKVPDIQNPEPPRVLDRGSNGFVVGEVPGWGWQHFDRGWEEMFRQGFLRGVLFSPIVEDRRLVLITRKSPYLPFDLMRAASALNDAENAMGEPLDWVADPLWLRGPKDGTLLPVRAILDLLVRV
jgi:hypothetical protein